MSQTLKLNDEKWKKSSFYKEKSLVGLTLGLPGLPKWRICVEGQIEAWRNGVDAVEELVLHRAVDGGRAQSVGLGSAVTR
jgi:hypothetical protein